LYSSHETKLTIDLNKLEYNFNYLKNKLNNNCKIIAVVKAFAYGHGDIEISKKLEKLGVHALWVADFEEGINLRKSGIKIPIIIANPGYKSIEEIIKFNLDVVIYNSDILDYFISENKKINVHIKCNTGMNRYGFNQEEMEELVRKLKETPCLNIQSICSHLASTDDNSKNKDTLKQIHLFKSVAKNFERGLSVKIDKHILNSNGLLNFPEHHLEMVRLGIGLYGSANDNKLKQISKLTTIISQNRNIQTGDKVGYTSSFITPNDMNISIVPVGYADGLNRKLGDEKGEVLIQNMLCPIIGKISMDSFIVDTSKIEVKVGDAVEIFGKNNTVIKMAGKLNTIPYEIYATLNRRIKRIYIGN